MQATFEVDKIETKLLLMSDVTYEELTEIVEVTRDKKKRPERLEWDIAKLPHHCSYTALGPDKGTDKTDPVDDVKWLYEDQGQVKGKIISPSKPINDWIICTDEKLISKLSRLRLDKLPNETGGVLLGSFDFERQIIYIVDTIPSPQDSQEWPTLYIRGSQGLKKEGGQRSSANRWYARICWRMTLTPQ